ncbi:hypothetical protein HELRODRAFT_158665 [Helobdella robusta]|uniref:Uncharacterized protein n=1 Tax=Helobdella robusta TaxID=6412 RepID=T1EN37_HELRO|nr:hypothetical protein HELRODRAFT_158665 [Helobdella robusta]ESO12200.1 hypothetical protein HELRODRAFT_158665 [Helobdella robusta]
MLMAAYWIWWSRRRNFLNSHGLHGVYSDHSLIQISSPMMFSFPVGVKKIVRSWNQVDYKKFISLILNSPICGPFESNDPEYLLNLFEREIGIITDTVAPKHIVTFKDISTSP